VLDVHGREHGDSGVEQLEHIFVALAMLAALDIGMRKLVNKRGLRLAREIASTSISSNVAPLYSMTLPVQFPAGQPVRDSSSSVSFDDADHNVLAAAVAADGLGQHGVGLAYARCVSKKELEEAAFFLAPLPQATARSLCHCALFSSRVYSLSNRA